jgi:hypothetical protein
LEIGGLYQKVQESFRVWAAAGSSDADDLVSEIDAMLGALPTVLDMSFDCPGLWTTEPMADSKGFPRDFGVFAPNEAKAPEPRPKALDAPLVGDVTPPPAPGVVALKGPVLICEGASPLWRLEKEPLREDSMEPFGPVP